MKAIIVILMSPIMLFFAVSAMQTIEYCDLNNMNRPLGAYILLLVVAVWCFIACKLSSSATQETKKKINVFFDNITK